MIKMLFLGVALSLVATIEIKGAAHSTSLMQRHYERVMRTGLDVYGVDTNGLWLASVDVLKGGLPDKPDPAVKRTYRSIHAPNGSNLYWDQPCLVAAYQLSKITGDPAAARMADHYVADFLERCVSPQNGLFFWGNHLYYDVIADRIVGFSGSHHEARPLPCAWELFWHISPEKTERCIRTMALQHIKEPDTGLFCRHADPKAITAPKEAGKGVHPFLESGGVLVQSLAWLYERTGRKDATLRDTALKVARYSFAHRNKKTGLLRNQPGPVKRWDYYASTTEVGLWAGCLLQAAQATGEPEFQKMAGEAVTAYLRYGYEESSGRFFGQLNVEDGQPRSPARQKTSGEETVYQPGRYADLWEPLFPTHNYPMSMAEACLTLWQQTRDPLFKQAVQRFARFIAISTPANEGKGAYADQYGRCIHFLARAAQEFGDDAFKRQAQALAKEAVSHLWVPPAGMFRSHPGEDRCDAVDGIGLLFLALQYLETGQAPDLMGFHW